MRWLVDGYNVIRRSPELSSRERESLEAGREALCRLLATTARASDDQFTVVFDGAGTGGSASGGAGVWKVFSSARETADRVLVRLAAQGGAVVSNDREVRRAATRAGAITVTTDEFLSHLGGIRPPPPISGGPDIGGDIPEKDEDDDAPRGPRKGNPRRLAKKARAARRALGRLGGSSGRP